MSSHDTDTCDRCGSTIVRDEFGRPRPFQFVTSSGESDDGEILYEEEARILCDACESDLLTWIDDGDIDRSACVDLPTRVESARAIRQTANTLELLAETLETELDTDE